MSATLKDVARAAGVSISTVSRVMRNERYISEETRARVLSSIEELQYQPDLMARQMKYGRTFAIGYVVPDISNPFFSRLAKGIERVIHSTSNPAYELILCNTEGSVEREKASIELLFGRRVEGIILASTAAEQSRSLVRQVVEERHVPVVAVDNELPGISLDLVTVDNREAAYQLARHLVGHGHTRIGVIAGPAGESSASERLDGIRLALSEAGLELPAELLAEGDWRAESGFSITSRLLSLASPPTAVFSSNNFMTVGALQAIRQMGLRIPEDIALVSFDDVEFGYLLSPAWTTLDYSFERLGETAAQLILDRINHKGRAASRHIRMPFRLLIRESCGCHATPDPGPVAGSRAN